MAPPSAVSDQGARIGEAPARSSCHGIPTPAGFAAPAAAPGPRTHRCRDWRGELLLALLPTATMLGVLGFVHALTEQRILFASLSASAFLIYLDPHHITNSIRTLISAQLLAAILGFGTYELFGSGYASAGVAMVVTIFALIWLDAVHPPAVATSISFALRAGDEKNLVLFVLAIAITALLVTLQRVSHWVLVRQFRTHDAPGSSGACEGHASQP